MRQGRQVAIALLGGISGYIFSVALPNLAWAQKESVTEPETVMERIARTGVLNAGVRSDAMPFSYLAEDKWVGYSIDMVHLIQEQLQQQLGRRIEVNFVPLTSGNRFSSVIQEKVDIYCGATSFTWSRDLDLDFSVGYFRTGTQLLVDADRSLGTEFRVGVIPGTTTEQVIDQHLALAQIVKVESRATGLLALEQGRIDALASDGILLEGLRRSLNDPQDYAVLPTQPYDYETYACILPSQNLDFQELVNHSLVEFMQGVINGDSQDVAIFETWFGDAGVTPADRNQLLDYFRQTTDAYERKLEQSTQNSSSSGL